MEGGGEGEKFIGIGDNELEFWEWEKGDGKGNGGIGSKRGTLALSIPFLILIFGNGVYEGLTEKFGIWMEAVDKLKESQCVFFTVEGEDNKLEKRKFDSSNTT